MKKLVGALSLCLLLANCGEKKEEKKGGFEMNRAKTEKKEEKVVEKTPIDMSNEGIGPYKDFSFPSDIDSGLASEGEAKYKNVCTACHMADKKLIGPALSGVYERRNATWVMNMMKNPTEMLRKDPIAKALLKEYNNAVMLDNKLSDQETRAIAEYLRTL
ncbi:cytochrome c [Cellulophaga baltica]|uniref:c-type cytochrome n=1 Tax=Cellulophaga TaxID=104264 RepID=UPI001C072E8B|nr:MULTISPECIES: cytochrome c [Cellulophaga]MBU2995711.1 cytochrome c [Cellulophaga baltica]MDO6767105.1 cytochrome c [Cellulophaga sp. 1_MG-2023]